MVWTNSRATADDQIRYRSKRPLRKEVDRLGDDLVVVHDEGVGLGNHEEIGHALDFGPFHRDLSVVLAGDHPSREDGVEGGVTIPRDDA